MSPLTELGRELVDLVAEWFPDERIELAADCAYCNSTLLDGLARNVVLFGSMRAQWYRGAGTGIVLIVITRCWTGKIPWRVYFCTDPKGSVRELLEGYSRRWSIEVAFRELKQQFGFANSCARSKNAVLCTGRQRCSCSIL